VLGYRQSFDLESKHGIITARAIATGELSLGTQCNATSATTIPSTTTWTGRSKMREQAGKRKVKKRLQQRKSARKTQRTTTCSTVGAKEVAENEFNDAQFFIYSCAGLFEERGN